MTTDELYTLEIEAHKILEKINHERRIVNEAFSEGMEKGFEVMFQTVREAAKKITENSCESEPCSFCTTELFVTMLNYDKTDYVRINNKFCPICGKAKQTISQCRRIQNDTTGSD